MRSTLSHYLESSVADLFETVNINAFTCETDLHLVTVMRVEDFKILNNSNYPIVYLNWT